MRHPDAAFDREGLLARLDGDVELMAELIATFVAGLPALREAIAAAVAARDGEALRHSAHTLKGAATNFGARTVVETAAFLERCGARQEWEPVDENHRKLDAALAQLSAELEHARGVA